MIKRGRKMEVYLPHGTWSEIAIGKLANWNGLALRLSRDAVEKESLDEDYTKKLKVGVYLLIYEANSIYINASENILDELTQQVKNYELREDNFFWKQVFIFTSDELSLELAQYLCMRLTNLINITGNYSVAFKNNKMEIKLSNPNKEFAEEFLDNIKIIIPTLGINPLECNHKKSLDKEVLWYLQGREIDAKGMVLAGNEFRLLTGAKISKTSSPKLIAGWKDLRKTLIASKVRDFVTVEDIDFTSPSSAASFVSGKMMGGPSHWRNEQGIPLGEVRGVKKRRVSKKNRTFKLF